MIFLGYPDSVKGYLFMWLPNNVLFKGTTTVFDEEMMPKCSKVVKRCFMPVGDKLPSTEDLPIPEEVEMTTIFLVIPDPLHLYKRTMQRWTTVLLSTVRR